MAAVTLLVVLRVRVIFAPLLLAATIVFLLNPVVSRLERRDPHVDRDAQVRSARHLHSGDYGPRHCCTDNRVRGQQDC